MPQSIIGYFDLFFPFSYFSLQQFELHACMISETCGTHAHTLFVHIILLLSFEMNQIVSLYVCASLKYFPLNLIYGSAKFAISSDFLR